MTKLKKILRGWSRKYVEQNSEDMLRLKIKIRKSEIVLCIDQQFWTYTEMRKGKREPILYAQPSTNRRTLEKTIFAKHQKRYQNYNHWKLILTSNKLN